MYSSSIKLHAFIVLYKDPSLQGLEYLMTAHVPSDSACWMSALGKNNQVAAQRFCVFNVFTLLSYAGHGEIFVVIHLMDLFLE